MADEQIASGRINLDLNDKEVLAGLREVEAQFDRTMRDIDRQHASADIDANIAPLEDAVARAKRKVRELEGQKASITIKAEKKRLDAAIKEARAEVKRLDGEKATIEIEYKSDTAALKATQARLKAIDDAAKAREVVERKIESARAQRARQELQRVNQLARTNKSLADQRAREMSQAEREARKVNDQLDREAASVPKLKRQYAELAVQIDRLNTTRGKVKRNEKATLVVDLKVAEAVAEMEALKATLIRIGKSPPDVEIKIKPGRRSGEAIRQAIHDGFRDGGVRKAIHDAGMLSGIVFTDALGEGIRRNLRPRTLLRSVGSGLAGVGSKLLGGLGKLSDATVRIGPFTATIKQAVLAVSLLAPVILDVVGALGSLVAVAGSGVVGALGAGTAAAGAFGLVLGSTALLLPSLMRDFKSLTTIQGAYHTAVLKYGKGSDQAKEKLKQFNKALEGATPTAKAAFMSFDKLQDSWRGLSKASRPAFLDAFGEAITTARASIKKFGPEVTQSFALVAGGVQSAFKALRSFEAQKIFQNLFDDGQAALPSFGRGLANLAHAAGLVAVAFGRILPSLGGGFEGWTKGVLKATQDTAKMNSLVQNSIESLRDIGHLAAASGKFLAAFFGGGVDAGQKFTVTMTNALNRWTAFLHTTRGQNNLHSFFSEAVDGAKSLWQTLGPLVSSFVSWAASIAPFARMFLQGTAAVSQMVSAFLRLTGLQSPISALVTTLGVLWGIGKISAATAAVTNFTRALIGMSVAERAASAAGAGGIGIPVVAGGARGGAFAAAAAKRAEMSAAGAAEATTRWGRALNVVKMAAVPAAAGAAAFAASTAGIALAAVGGVTALGLYVTRTSDFQKSTAKAAAAGKQWRAGLAAQPQLHLDVATAELAEKQATLGVEQALKAVNKLRKDGRINTAQGKQAILDYNSALLSQKDSVNRVSDAQKAEAANLRATTKAAKERVDQAKKAVAQEKDKKPGLLDSAVGLIPNIGPAANLARSVYEKFAKRKLDLDNQLTVAQDRYKIAQDRAFLGTMNQQRAIAGMAPIAQRTATALANVNRLGGKTLATKISVKDADPGQVSKLASSANRALQSGVKPARIKIIVDGAKTAADAVRGINKITLTAKRLKIIESGGSEAVRMAARLAGIKLTPVEAKIISKGGPEALREFARVAGVKLPIAWARIKEQGSSQVISKWNAVKRINFQIKTQTIREAGSAAVLGALKP